MSASCEAAPRSHARWTPPEAVDGVHWVAAAECAGEGAFAAQFASLLAVIDQPTRRGPAAPVVVCGTVFLRGQGDRPEAARLLAAHFNDSVPPVSFVVQPPASGAAAAVEWWGIDAGAAQVERFGAEVTTVTARGLRWLHVGGIAVDAGPVAHAQTHTGLERIGRALAVAGGDLGALVRTWFYLGEIGGHEAGGERYQEFNRGRSEVYRGVHFRAGTGGGADRPIYPASTGIGMEGGGLTLAGLALQSERGDVVLRTIENPGQVPAYQYSRRYSPESPKFSRAMSVTADDFAGLWVSGTASIRDSESTHVGDFDGQVRQTMENIERLISPANLAAHGLERGGATLADLAVARVYLKRAADAARCEELLRPLFGDAPVIQVVADVCRPELLVEIEAAFFPRCGRARP